MAEELRLNIVSTADSKGLSKAAQDLKETKGEADKLGQSFEDMGENAEKSEQKVSSATKGVRSHAEQIKILRAEYEKTTRTIADLDAQLLGGEGDTKSIRKDLREQRTFLRELERVAKEVKRSSGINFSLGGAGLPGAAGGGLAGLGRIAGVPAPVIGGLVAAASAAAPAIGSIIGGAIIGAVGTGGMALGLLSAAKDTSVQAAAKSFGQTLSAEFFQGDAFVEPAIKGLGILEDAFRNLNLNDTLAMAASTVEPIAHGFADFATNFMPGLDKTLERIGPFADAAAEGIANTGDALGDMIDLISSSEGSVDGLRLLFAGLGGTLRLIGAELKFLGDRWHEVINVAGMFTSIGAHTGFSTLDQGVRQLTGHSKELSGEMHFLGTETGQAAAMSNEHHRALLLEHTEMQAATRKAQDLADAQTQVALSARDVKDAWAELHGAQMTLDESLKRAYDGLEQVKDAFEGVNDSVKGDSQGAVERRLALEQEAAAAIAAAQAYLDMTGDAAGAQKKLDDFKKKAEDATGATGGARKAVNELADALFRLPENRKIYVTTIFRNSFEADFRAGERDSSGRPPTSGIATRASGGPVMAGIPYMINERGRETVTFPAGGQVHPASLSPMGGNARPLYITPSGMPLVDAAFEWLRTEIASRGGTLAVLGIRG